MNHNETHSMDTTQQTITPGPWEQDTEDFNLVRTVDESRKVGGLVIAKAFGACRDNTEANAKAIAAVPEMVAALREVATNAFVPLRFADLAREALKKAGAL